MAEAIFIPQGEGRYFATEAARGPWDPNAQHGGAPASLLAHAFEALPTVEGVEIARITYEYVRPVPLGDLSVRAEVVRPGRRVQLMEASVFTPDEVDVVRARALSVQRARDIPADVPAGDAVPPPPDRGLSNDYPSQPHELFALDGVELRFVAGTFLEPGAATAWCRLRLPVVQGAETTPLQRMTAAADFGNGISSPLSWDEYVFINPDLTLYVEREAIGEWIALEATTRISEGGIGLSESVLYDERGRVGRAIQSLLVAKL